MDRRLDDFQEMLMHELEETVRGGSITPEMICNADKVVDMIYDIQRMRYGDEMTAQYSRGRDYQNGGSYGGYGYGRDGDNDGRYNESRGYSGYGPHGRGSYEGTSYDGSYEGGSGNSNGYSRNSESAAMISDLEHAMHKARTQKDRENIQRLINQMRQQ